VPSRADVDDRLETADEWTEFIEAYLKTSDLFRSFVRGSPSNLFLFFNYIMITAAPKRQEQRDKVAATFSAKFFSATS
jgi:hypothetical protein